MKRLLFLYSSLDGGVDKEGDKRTREKKVKNKNSFL